MRTPDAWEALLLAAAAFRLWRLLAWDVILDRPRNRIMVNAPQAADDWLLCPWCSGFWVAVGWWGAWLAWPSWTVGLAVPFALSAAVGLVALLDRD